MAIIIKYHNKCWIRPCSKIKNLPKKCFKIRWKKHEIYTYRISYFWNGLGEREKNWGWNQSYTYQVLQTIQIEHILLCVWAEPAVLGSAKTTLKFKYRI